MNKISLHGNENFDKRYFGDYYKKYSQDELTKAYRWFKGWIRLIEQMYPIQNGEDKKVLEVGCGIGAFSKILRDRGFTVSSSDISGFIISKAKKLQKGIDFKVENIEKTRGRKSEYDLIFAFEVLEHLKDPKKSMKNLKKRLKEGGTLIFSSPYPTKRTLADPTHISVKTPEQWIKIGKEIGFKKTRFQYVSFLPLLYRYNSLLSRAFPLKTNLPIIVNTCFFFFEH